MGCEHTVVVHHDAPRSFRDCFVRRQPLQVTPPSVVEMGGGGSSFHPSQPPQPHARPTRGPNLSIALADTTRCFGGSSGRMPASRRALSAWQFRHVTPAQARERRWRSLSVRGQNPQSARGSAVIASEVMWVDFVNPRHLLATTVGLRVP